MSSMNEDLTCSGRILAVRERLGLSQSAFAAELNLAYRSYQNYERGDREAPIALIKALFEKFNINPLWLIAGKSTMHIEATNREDSIDASLLEKLINSVEEFSTELPKPLRNDHKSMLIALLYKKSFTQKVSSGFTLDDNQIQEILRLVS